MDSILTSIKKLLGMTADYTHFDTDIIMHINTSLMYVNLLGVGPEDGFVITDNVSKWEDLLGVGNISVEAVKTYVYLQVRLIFDPPQLSYVIEAFNKQILELAGIIKLQVEREVTE